MDRFDDSPPPPRPAAGGNNPNSSSGAEGGGPSSPPPPAAPSGEEAAERNLSSPPQPERQQQQQGGSSVYDLFLAAVGLTPRGLGADAFSPGGPEVQAGEEDYWSAFEEGGEDGAGAGGARTGYGNAMAPLYPGPQEQPRTSLAATATVPVVGAGRGESSDHQQVRAGNSGLVTGGYTASAVAIVSEAARATQPGAAPAVGGRDTYTGVVGGHRPVSAWRTQQRQGSETDIRRRSPGGELDSQAGHTPLDTAVGAMHAATVAQGTARRRRRLFGSNSAAESASESRTPSSRPSSSTTPRVFSAGNGLFRSGNLGSFLRSNVVDGSATFDDENDEEDEAARGGTRAVERAINGASAATAAARGGRATASAVAGVEINGRGGGRSALSRGGGSNSLDASERGDGGGGGDGSSTSGQGRILFYHKPTLANVPAGDVPDVVPVYLGCPRGNMALGLPLNEAWQGEEHQDTTFNQNLSYTILSWPEDHVQDLLELWRLQVFFFTTIVFNILVSALLFFADNPDRTRVEGFARAGAFPEPFQQRSPADDPTGLRSEEWHLATALLLSILGVVCVLARLRAGIALYLVLTVINAVVGLSHSPDPLFASRYAVDVVLVAMGRSYLSSLTYTWVTASAGDGRRG